ncbi:MAG TPA: hypothetical protein VG098_05675, partial [Nitrososphaera sp.]|nr:hypothetical protein [Nitrososphaera sp.]
QDEGMSTNYSTNFSWESSIIGYGGLRLTSHNIDLSSMKTRAMVTVEDLYIRFIVRDTKNDTYVCR